MQMKMAFLILIGAVFIVSIFFGFLIWRQTIKFEKKAFVAKEKLHQEIAELGLLETDEEVIQKSIEE